MIRSPHATTMSGNCASRGTSNPASGSVPANFDSNSSVSKVLKDSFESNNTYDHADQKRVKSCCPDPPSTTPEKDDVDPTLPPSNAGVAPQSCKGRKRKFSESDLHDPNDSSLLSSDRNNPCESPPQERPTLRRPSPGPRIKDGTFDLPGDSNVDAGKYTSIQSNPLFNPHLQDDGDAAKEDVSLPTRKYVIDESGQTWIFDCMRKTGNGRMRRQYIKQRKAGPKGTIWIWPWSNS